MITIAALLAFCSFYAFYATSGRVKMARRGQLVLSLQGRDRIIARAFGLMLAVFSLLVLIAAKGICIGTLAFCVILMALGSAVVLFTPLRTFRLPVVIVFFGLSLTTEFFFV